MPVLRRAQDSAPDVRMHRGVPQLKKPAAGVLSAKLERRRVLLEPLINTRSRSKSSPAAAHVRACHSPLRRGPLHLSERLWPALRPREHPRAYSARGDVGRPRLAHARARRWKLQGRGARGGRGPTCRGRGRGARCCRGPRRCGPAVRPLPRTRLSGQVPCTLARSRMNALTRTHTRARGTRARRHGHTGTCMHSC